MIFEGCFIENQSTFIALQLRAQGRYKKAGQYLLQGGKENDELALYLLYEAFYNGGWKLAPNIMVHYKIGKWQYDDIRIKYPFTENTDGDAATQFAYCLKGNNAEKMRKYFLHALIQGYRPALDYVMHMVFFGSTDNTLQLKLFVGPMLDDLNIRFAIGRLLQKDKKVYSAACGTRFPSSLIRVKLCLFHYQTVTVNCYDAVISWIILAKRLKISRDVYRMIGKIVWKSRKSEAEVWGWERKKKTWKRWGYERMYDAWIFIKALFFYLVFLRPNYKTQSS